MIQHLAIVPDGNRRWARRHGVPSTKGHQIGAKTTEMIFQKAIELNIPYVTFWAASYDNFLKRSKEEVKFLIQLLNEEFRRLIEDSRIHQNKVKVRILGRFREILPPSTLKIIEKLIKKTEKYNLFSLTFLLAYNGTDEMVDAFRRITSAISKSTLKITGDVIKSFLWTRDLPPVDLVFRTGVEGDPHNSAGFMMWHTAYSQYYFTKTLYPALKEKEFVKAIEDFNKRERRFGK